MPPTQPLGRPDPIRPPQGGTEPIPERVRQPIQVPQKESTIAGLPRALVIAAVLGLAVAVLVGFLIGRAIGGEETAPRALGRRAACERALTLALQVSALQEQAIANRTETLQVLVLGDQGAVEELADGLAAISAATDEARSELTPAVERCRSGGGGGKRRGGDGRRGNGGTD